ncbi:unnamed protein product [Rodentolepis nana]|uniref:Glyco_transf_64 domain-containing protein n=1 Tax=Rodentolepis nana TaxID=102285 RepID=A0A0R3TQH4_RODNA|nr:unnamed protein product [Rodentolepis nana]
MYSIHASLQNELLLTEQSCRSLIKAKTELENQVTKLRNDLAIAERDLLRLQTSIDSYQIPLSNFSFRQSFLPISFSLPFTEYSTHVGCTMHTCFNWTACRLHSHKYLRVCFSHGSVVGDHQLHYALLRSPHYSTSCSQACLRIIFSPVTCNSTSCLYIGPPTNSLPPNVIRASPIYSNNFLFRPGFDLIIAPFGNRSNDSLLPMIVRRETKWLLGASLGTSNHSELNASFLADLNSGIGKDDLVNINLGTSSDGCLKNFGGDNFTLWRPCDDASSILSASTFCLLIDSILDNVQVYTTIGEQLVACLCNAAIPVFLSRGGGIESRLFPFWEILDSKWRKAVVFLPRRRLPHLVTVLRSIDENTRVEMLLQGQEIWRKYLSSTEAQLATIFLTLSGRLGLPQPPAPLYRSAPALSSGRFQPERLYQPRPEVLAQVDVDGLLGPIGPKWDSPPQSSFGPFLAALGSLKIDQFWTHINTPWSSPLLPTEFQFINVMNASNYRPINHSVGMAGKEFAANIGGMHPYEQFTIVVLTYDRDSILTLMLEGLLNLAYLHSVVVIWNNPKPPSESLLWPRLHVPIQVVKSEKNSLNNRFLPYDVIKTEAILMLDDDVTLRHDEIILGFRVWRENRDRIVGFPARGHFWSAANQSWYYNSAHACEYSMILTGASFIHRYYLHAYTNEMPAQIREIVEQKFNCEDIAMNFLVSHITRKPPLKVTTHWSFICTNCTSTLYNGGSHIAVRSECINQFERIYGYNPLIYTQYRADSVLFKTRLPLGMEKCFKYV